MPLLGWRRWPLTALVVVGGCSIALAIDGVSFWLPVGLAVGLYLFTSRRGHAAAWTPATMTIVVVVLAGYLALSASVSEAIHAAVAFAAAWFAGERTRLRGVQVTQLGERADRAERDAARERELAVAEERTRIARDLHDSAAHALNVIAVRAGAARLRHDPDRDLAALTAIEELARQTMTDIDHVIGSLRPGAGEPVELPPGLSSLDALLAQHGGAGHDLTITVHGTPRPLTAPVDHGAFRILQEALTNAARYGSGGTRVELGYGTRELTIVVSNRVRAALSPAAGNGGHGLIGMRERATSLGGNLAAQRDGGRFRLTARLPYGGRTR